MKRKRKKDILAGIPAEETAKKRVWMILQVLSGQMGVSDAAKAAEVSMTRYYQLEQKALKGMLHALSPAASKERGTPVEQLARIRKKNETLAEENSRQKQILRMARKLWGPLAQSEAKKSQKKEPLQESLQAG